MATTGSTSKAAAAAAKADDLPFTGIAITGAVFLAVTMLAIGTALRSIRKRDDA
ncbi:MAG: hypothetical protein H0T78_07825 [Longispora sp.]|nr:hypothetical protein [Longispora sp. (in: high G+C Gram-positive bacteria)]